MTYKELHAKYMECIANFVRAINSIQTETTTYVKLSNDDLEITAHGDCTKHYIHSIKVDDIILQ